jgi:hypothetical protein
MRNRDGLDLMLSLAGGASRPAPNGPGGARDVYSSLSEVGSEIEALRAAGVEIERGPEDAVLRHA